MELFDNVMMGLTTALSLKNLAYCLLGTILGTAIGVLPGVGPTATIALLLPYTVALDPTTALIMLAGIYYGAQYGGSTTAILINLPGEASSAVTAIDGHQMARQGRAGPALTIAALGSFVAGTFATFVIVFFAPALASMAIKFGPHEYFSLIVLGLVFSVTLAHGSAVKAIAMVVLGLLLGLIGTDVSSGTWRFTLGFPELADGVNFVALSVAFFGTAELLKNLEGEVNKPIFVSQVTSLMPTREDLRRSINPILRGTVFGSILGVLPGGGALLSAFAAYTLEKKLSKNPQEFGRGAIEGVAAPESANNAGAQTSFIPMLTLGIPSNAVMAMMIGAMIIQGITPGPKVATEQPALFWGLIASMWIGNLMLLVLNLPLIGVWVRLLKVPYWMLFPGIIMFSVIGIHSMNWNFFDIYGVIIIGIIGYALIKVECEPAPLLLGFVLGPMLEEHLRRAMLFSFGNMATFVTRPWSCILLIMALIAFVVVLIPAIAQSREKVFVE